MYDMNRALLASAKVGVLSSGLFVGLCATSAQAQAVESIELVNHSFESPSVFAPDNPFRDINVAVGITGWQATFPGSVPNTLPIPPDVVLPPELLGQLNVGVFFNVPVPIEDIVIPPIENALGNQVAFMLVNPSADGVTDTQVSIFQESQAVFEADTDYTFTLAIGNAVTFAADDSASLILSIGTVDELGDFQAAGLSNTVFASELVNDRSGLLTDFDVTLSASEIGASLLGEQVAVRILQDGGQGGGINFDNARLTAVPEPGSIALLGAGALMLTRRRRR